MVNVNYDSFYKFLVSLGIIMCTLPVTILLFLFTDSFNLQISEADLSEYTKTAQNVIRMKQFTPLLIEKWYTWLISAIFFLAGFFLICLGMKKWYQLQKFDDIRKKREAQEAMEAIKKHTTDMSDEQIIQKNAFDMSDEQIIQNHNIPESTNSIAMKGFLVKQKYFNFVKSTKRTYLIKRNIIIGRCEYDIVAFSNRLFEKDYVYEIKYMRKGITSGRIERCRENMEKLKNNFSETLNRIPYMVLAIVVPDEVYEHTLSITNNIEKWNNNSIEVIKESELPEA